MRTDLARATVARIEALIQEDVGRNVSALFAAARGGLWEATAALATASKPSVAIMTGIYVSTGLPPALETDGPVGAAQLALGLRRIGICCRLVTDALCRTGCMVALDAAGIGDVPVDVVELGGTLDDVIAAWRRAGVSHVVSIERCGRSADGLPRNIRGVEISAFTVSLDELFLAGPWRRLAIGDGGNEIGMGSLPPSLVAAHVQHGDIIACVTPSDHLIVAGVSNWGAWGLLAGLAAARSDWRAALLACLDPALHHAVLEALVYRGPAVDGISRAQALTVDGLDASVHMRKLLAIRAVVEAMNER